MATEDELLKPVRARGRALRRTEKQLDEMTSVETLQSFVNEAREDWKGNAPKLFKTILEAEPKP